MSTFHVSAAADADLDELADYLARVAGIDTALRFYDAATATFASIARNPGIGESRPSTQPRLAGLRVGRVRGFENHLVYYRPVDGGIEVVRVLHGSRDAGRFIDLDVDDPA